MRPVLIAPLLLVLLASCGADGAPQPPGGAARTDGIKISGEARAGVVISE